MKLLHWLWSWFYSINTERCFRVIEPKKEPEKKREWMLWIGDGMAPAGPHLIGSSVDFDGRKGKCVDTTLLTILVEWED